MGSLFVIRERSRWQTIDQWLTLDFAVFPEREKPYFVKGMSICAAFMFFNALLALTLRVYLAWENRKFERRDAASRENGSVLAKPGSEYFEDEGYGFRNVL